MALKHVNAVIVGAGAGGGVVAKELSEAGLSVALLERGPWPQFELHDHDELISQRVTVLGNAFGPDDERHRRVVSTGNGGWSYAGNIKKNANYVMYDLSVYDTGNMPWLFPQAFYNRYQNADIARVNGELAALNACAVQAFPSAVLTAAEQAALDPVQARLGRYVDESLARFVLGEWDIRSAADMAAYRAGLTENGSATLTALWQGVADRLANQAQ